MKSLLALVGSLVATAALAQTPAGAWKTVDDATGKEKAVIRITEANGVFTGKIEKLLDPTKQDSKCDECTDDRKGQLILGLEIIRGARKAEGKDVWEGGRILDPENGRNYTLRLTPVEGGKKLEVRGSFGPFGRTQTWQRVQ